VDAGFFPLQWHCRHDQPGVEEDGLTEGWCTYTEKPGRKAVHTHGSRSQTVQRIRPIILFSVPLYFVLITVVMVTAVLLDIDLHIHCVPKKGSHQTLGSNFVKS